jgi:transcriptional regulator with XRE-family HTH domain
MANVRPVNTRWFKDRLADRKLSMRKVAKQLDLEPSAVSLMLRGLRKIKIEEAAALAPMLGVPLNEVLMQCGFDLSHAVEGEHVPVVGWADPDWRVHMGESTGPKLVVAPPNKGTVALRDQSGGFWDGWLMYYKPTEHIRPKAIGRLSVVELLDTGEKLIRWLKPLLEPEDAYYLLGVGGAASGAVRIKSASPILWVKH